MRLFYKKPFALCCFLLVCGALIGYFAPFIIKIAVMTLFALCALIFLTFAVIKKKHTLFIKVSLPLFFLLIGVIYFTVYTSYIESEFEKYTSENESVEIEVTVLSRSYYSNYLCVFEIRTHRIGDDKVNKKMRFVSERALDIVSGERIEMAVFLSEFENDGSFNEKQYYNSRGIYFLATEADGSCKVIGKDKSLELFFLNLNDKFCRRFETALEKDSSSLINAIFLGNRSDLTDSLKRDFKRTGTYHLLALSGMHLSVLSLLLDRLLKRLRVKKTIRYATMPIIIVFYVALTGFGLSVVRSAIMAMAAYLAYFLRTKSDSFTTLSFAAAAIIIFSPSAIIDIGFWMSVLATFGIVMAIPLETFIRFKLRRRLKNKLGKSLKSILTGLIFSFAAILFTLPFSCFNFKAISLIGPFITLVLSPFVSLILSLAPFLLIFTDLPLISDALTFLIDISSQIISGVAGYFSNLENIYVSLEYPFVKFMVIPFFIILAILLLINLRHKFIIPIFVITYILVFSVFEFISFNDPATYVDYIHSKQNEYICLSCKGENTLIDISDGSSSNIYNAAVIASLKGNCEIETIVLTHLHKKHISSLNKLSDQFMIRRVAVPLTLNDDEAFIASSIKAEMEAKGIEVHSYQIDESVEIAKGTFMIADRAYIKRSTHPVILVSLEGVSDICYIGSSYWEYADIPEGSSNIIIGTHGPICKQKFTISADDNTALISLADEEVLSFASISGGEKAKILKNTERISLVIE